LYQWANNKNFAKKEINNIYVYFSKRSIYVLDTETQKDKKGSERSTISLLSGPRNNELTLEWKYITVVGKVGRWEGRGNSVAGQRLMNPYPDVTRGLWGITTSSTPMRARPTPRPDPTPTPHATLRRWTTNMWSRRIIWPQRLIAHSRGFLIFKIGKILLVGIGAGGGRKKRIRSNSGCCDCTKIGQRNWKNLET